MSDGTWDGEYSMRESARKRIAGLCRRYGLPLPKELENQDLFARDLHRIESKFHCHNNTYVAMWDGKYLAEDGSWTEDILAARKFSSPQRAGKRLYDIFDDLKEQALKKAFDEVTVAAKAGLPSPDPRFYCTRGILNLDLPIVDIPDSWDIDRVEGEMQKRGYVLPRSNVEYNGRSFFLMFYPEEEKKA